MRQIRVFVFFVCERLLIHPCTSILIHLNNSQVSFFFFCVMFLLFP